MEALERIAKLESESSDSARLQTLLEEWSHAQRAVEEALGITENDLGISPSGTGAQRIINISKLRETHSKLKELSEGFRIISEKSNGYSRNLAQNALGEVKFKLYCISRSIQEFEEQRLLAESHPKAGLRSSSNLVVAQSSENHAVVREGEISIPSTILESQTMDEEGCFSMDEELMGSQQQYHSNSIEEKEISPRALSSTSSCSQKRFANQYSNPLDKYEMGSYLKKSLQGEIRLAINKETSAYVAIKVCKKELIDTKKSLSGANVSEDVRNEARLMEYLNTPGHRNVLKVVESFETEESYYLVMEYASRGEFYEIVSQAGRLDEEVARIYFKQLVDSVKYVHDHGVVHLDLSLENVLMDDIGVLKLCDFGLAKRALGKGRKFESSKNRPGKIQYMSPEIYSGVSYNGEKSDCFSLGVILFVILTGFPPFNVPSVSDIRFSLIMQRQLKKLIMKWKLENVVSKSAMDLLSKLMCNEDERLTTEEILAHEWLKGL